MISSDSNPSETMKYALLGEDTTSTEEKLAKYVGEVNWEYLRPHFRRDALLYVDPELDLKTVGTAFSEDDRDAVAVWLKRGDLVKIGELHAEQWENADQQFEALVVSPFVLCRPLGGA